MSDKGHEVRNLLNKLPYDHPNPYQSQVNDTTNHGIDKNAEASPLGISIIFDPDNKHERVELPNNTILELPFGYTLNYALILGLDLYDETDSDGLPLYASSDNNIAMLQVQKTFEFTKILEILTYYSTARKTISYPIFVRVFKNGLCVHSESKLTLLENEYFERIGISMGDPDVTFADFLEYLRNIDTASVDIYASCETLLEIILSTIECAALYSLQFNKCKLCGRYFIPATRSDEKYCGFSSRQYGDKTCRQVSKLIIDNKRKESKPSQKLRKKIDDRLGQRYERHFDEASAAKDLESLKNFRDAAKERRSMILEGLITPLEYENWLVMIDEQTKRKGAPICQDVGKEEETQ